MVKPGEAGAAMLPRRDGKHAGALAIRREVLGTSPKGFAVSRYNPAVNISSGGLVHSLACASGSDKPIAD